MLEFGRLRACNGASRAYKLFGGASIPNRRLIFNSHAFSAYERNYSTSRSTKRGPSNPYDILGVSREAKGSEVKKAYFDVS